MILEFPPNQWKDFLSNWLELVLFSAKLHKAFPVNLQLWFSSYKVIWGVSKPSGFLISQRGFPILILLVKGTGM